MSATHRRKRAKHIMSHGKSVALILIVMAALMILPAAVPSVPASQAQGSTPPILLVVNDQQPQLFGRYLGEILRAEGLNAYDVVALANLTAADLTNHDLTILAQTILSAGQATLFRNHVNGGGRLIALRPDPQIADLFGLGAAAGTLTDGYLKIDPAATLAGAQPGTGLTGETLQIHGVADQYGVTGGMVTLAQLYTNATQATAYPAVVGSTSGRAIAFTYNLAQNVVYTRQGNPANADLDVDSDTYFRTIDLFQSASGGAPWVNRDKIPIPQADVQQRLFARLVRQLVSEVRPLPQLWYFPGQTKTALVLTGDAHGNPTSYYQTEIDSINARGGKITFYLSLAGEPNDASVQAWRSQGHTFGIHPYAYRPDSYPPFNITNLAQGYQVFTNWFDSAFTSPPSRTVRNHGVEWSGWTDSASIAASHGYAMDTNFYHWGDWLRKADGTWPHGYMTGSGQAMKFITSDGVILPIYQQLTQLVDEHLVAGAAFEGINSTQAVALSRQLIDASQAGDYAAIMTQFHVDYWGDGTAGVWAEGTVDYARSLGIPILNADQWLSFVEARHDANFSNILWDGATGQLSFNLQAAATEHTMSVLLPLTQGNVNFNSVLVDGNPNGYQTFSVSGVEYARVTVSSGNHSFAVGYGALPNTPTPTSTAPTATPTLTATPTTAAQTPTPASTPTPIPTPPAGIAPGVTLGGTIAEGNLSVVVPGKFRLDFSAAAGWQPVSWYDLAADPAQDLANKGATRAARNVLNPPMELLYNSVWYSLDDAQNASIGILENNSARIVLYSQYQLQPAGANLLVQTTYSIYASGRVAVHMQVTNTAAGSVLLSQVEYPFVNVEDTLSWSVADLDANHTLAFQRSGVVGPASNLVVTNRSNDTTIDSDSAGDRYWTVPNIALASGQAFVRQWELLLAPGGLSTADMTARSTDVRSAELVIAQGATVVGNGFNLADGAHTMQATGDPVSFYPTATTNRHAPVFVLDDWQSATWSVSLNGAVIASSA